MTLRVNCAFADFYGIGINCTPSSLIATNIREGKYADFYDIMALIAAFAYLFDFLRHSALIATFAYWPIFMMRMRKMRVKCEALMESKNKL